MYYAESSNQGNFQLQGPALSANYVEIIEGICVDCEISGSFNAQHLSAFGILIFF